MSALPLPLVEAFRPQSPRLPSDVESRVQPEVYPLHELSEDKSLAEPIEECSNIQNGLSALINSLATTGLEAHRYSESPQRGLPDPPFVPYNTPALTPSNSSPKFTLSDACSESPGSVPADLLGAPLIRSSSRFSGLTSFDLSMGSGSSSSSDEFDLSSSNLLDLPIESPIRPSTFPHRSDMVGLGIFGLERKGQPDPPSNSLAQASAKFSSPSPSVGLVCPQDDFLRIPAGHDVDGNLNPYTLTSSESGSSVSEMFMQQMVRSLRNDDLRMQVIKAIPDCVSWYELGGVSRSGSGDVFLDRPVATSTPLPFLAHRQLPRRLQSPNAEMLQVRPRLKKHFSSSTISSELKRVHSLPPTRRRFVCTRPRSVSCPVEYTSFPALEVGQAPAVEVKIVTPKWRL